jgi:hypothetical protein
MANLLQISSAFGRAMESIDRTAMCNALYPALLQMTSGVDNVIAAAAEGYAFSTNLDLDPPLDGLAPPSQADVVRQAVRERWTPDQLASALAAHALRHMP